MSSDAGISARKECVLSEIFKNLTSCRSENNFGSI